MLSLKKKKGKNNKNATEYQLIGQNYENMVVIISIVNMPLPEHE